MFDFNFFISKIFLQKLKEYILKMIYFFQKILRQNAKQRICEK